MIEVEGINGVLANIGEIAGSVADDNEINGELNNTMVNTHSVSSYNELNDKPSINGIELTGNKTLEELGIEAGGDVDLSNYYTKEEVDNKIPNLEDYALKSEIPDVSVYQTEEDVNALISEAIGGIENGSY